MKLPRLVRLLLILPLTLFVVACNEHPIDSLVLDHSDLTMRIGESKQLEVIVLPLSSSIYTRVYWTSSDVNVATVDQTGRVTAVYSGECRITAANGDMKAVCNVSVNTLDYSITFEDAIAYYNGDLYGGTDNLVLRLLGQGLSIGVDGSMQGSGMFLTLDANAPTGTPSIVAGEYAASTDRTQTFGFQPGELVESGNSAYATGSYLGFYQAEGLSAIFVKNGSFVVAQNGTQFSVSGNVVGERNEDIAFTYDGPITFVDRTAPSPDTLRLQLQTPSVQNLGDLYTTGYDIYRVTAASGQYTLRMECYVLQSAAMLPSGAYSLSATPSLFALRASDIIGQTGSLLFDNGTPIALLYGSTQIVSKASGLTLSGAFVAGDGRVIILQ